MSPLVPRTHQTFARIATSTNVASVMRIALQHRHSIIVIILLVRCWSKHRRESKLSLSLSLSLSLCLARAFVPIDKQRERGIGVIVSMSRTKESRTPLRRTIGPTVRHQPLDQHSLDLTRNGALFVSLIKSTMTTSMMTFTNLLCIWKTWKVVTGGLEIVGEGDCHQRDEGCNIAQELEHRGSQPPRQASLARETQEDTERNQAVPHGCCETSPVFEPAAEPTPRPMREPTSDPCVAVVRVSASIARESLPSDPHSHQSREYDRGERNEEPSRSRSRKPRSPWMSGVCHEHDEAREESHVAKNRRHYCQRVNLSIGQEGIWTSLHA